MVGGEDGQKVRDLEGSAWASHHCCHRRSGRGRRSNGCRRSPRGLRQPRSSSAGRSPPRRRARCRQRGFTATVGKRTTSEITAVRRKASTWILRCRCQADTASMTTAPVTRETRTPWVWPQRNTGLVEGAQMLFSSGTGAVVRREADGCCVPGVGSDDEGRRQSIGSGVTSQMQARWAFLDRRFQRRSRSEEGRLQEEGGEALMASGPPKRCPPSASRRTSSCRTRTPG